MWFEKFTHSVRIRGKTFMFMTFYSLIVLTYGFQHYMTLTWLQWQMSHNGCCVLKQTKYQSISMQETKNYQMALFLTGSHTFQKPEMKKSLPTIYIYFWNPENIGFYPIELEIKNTITLGLIHSLIHAWNWQWTGFDWNITTKEMIWKLSSWTFHLYVPTIQ